jgi:hypothetical protein
MTPQSFQQLAYPARLLHCKRCLMSDSSIEITSDRFMDATILFQGLVFDLSSGTVTTSRTMVHGQAGGTIEATISARVALSPYYHNAQFHLSKGNTGRLEIHSETYQGYFDKVVVSASRADEPLDAGEVVASHNVDRVPVFEMIFKYCIVEQATTRTSRMDHLP